MTMTATPMTIMAMMLTTDTINNAMTKMVAMMAMTWRQGGDGPGA